MTDLLPDIFLYNPSCEFAIGNGSANWQPNKILQKMESDLSALPMFFAKNSDFVLVDSIPSSGFIDSIKQFNIEIPSFILKSEAINNPDFLSSPKNKLSPWGWSPSAHKFLSPIKESCSNEFQQSPVFTWKPEHREITSRKFAASILNQIISNCNCDFLLPTIQAPKICTEKIDFENAINQYGSVMIKAPWSSSGRGLQTISKTPVHEKVWERIMGIVKNQGYAIVEPLLNKVLDLALLFEIKKGKIEFLGTSYFNTDKKGQYEGNFLNGLPSSTEQKVVDFAGKAIEITRKPLVNAIECSDLVVNYEGVLGVDMLIYTDENGVLKINPCLEINVRHTMGMLALQLKKLIHQNKKAMYKTWFQPGISFNVFKKEMEKKYPLKIVDNKISSGFFALTEAGKESLFGAYLLV